MQEKIFEILFDKDEITWQTIIYELVRTEQMDPWDVDVSLISQRYIEMLAKLKELDFRISGKVLLAAALLLKIKSNRLVGEDMAMFDKLLSEPEDVPLDDSLFDDEPQRLKDSQKYSLIPRTPQPRKRKVSIFDLVKSLEKALEVQKRRTIRNYYPPTTLVAPKKGKEITLIIKEVYQKIRLFFTKNKSDRMTFTQIMPSENREDKVYTFIPLLHLATQQKIELNQEQHFGEIEIKIFDKAKAG